ncbi:unnamed protein product [Amaranthus hypochondriacus]
MARLRLTRALSKYGIARNDVLSSNLHRDSATSLVNTSKAAMQQQTFIHNAANFESRACQVPEIHLLGLQQANIGRDLTGSADAVMQIYGSWHKRSMTGGAAWILKDEKLKSVDGGCLQSYASSSLQMEILACLHGIKWAKARQIRNVSIYTNSLNLLQLLQGSIPLDIGLFWPIQEIKYQAVLLNWCCVHKVSKYKTHHARNASIACRAGLLTPNDFY